MERGDPETAGFVEIEPERARMPVGQPGQRRYCFTPSPCMVVSTISTHDAANFALERYGSVVPLSCYDSLNTNDNFDQFTKARAQRHALDRQIASGQLCGRAR